MSSNTRTQRKPALKRKKVENEDSTKQVKKLKLCDEDEAENKTKKTIKVENEKIPKKVKKPKLVDEDEGTEKTKKPKSKTFDSQIGAPQWGADELLAEQYDFNINVARNIVHLFEEGNTIPFIARYRRDLTKNMEPEYLRAVKESYDEIIALKSKINTVLKNLDKTQALTEDLKRAVTCSRSIEELEYVYAPYKPGSKRTLAERAKELGLEEAALTLLHNKSRVNLHEFVSSDKEELADIASVEKGIVHIIASVMATDTEILSSLRQLRKDTNFIIKTKKSTSKQSTSSGENKGNNELKFENYVNFESSSKYIKPHQILAINRGKNLNVLSVKVVVPDSLLDNFKKLCLNKWLNSGDRYQHREKIINHAVEDAYQRLVEPLLRREVTSELKQKAERASCEVFSTNLKHLLLATPLKGKSILGIDPGFSNGCKLALISPMGNVIAKDVIYPHSHKKDHEKDVTVLKNMLLIDNCELIALGNGTACRQTEEWLTNLIQNKVFCPLDITYAIVREEGASIYSCSPEAKKEFPDLDPNIISAVSLARRVQEPLAELIKIEPKHLGIGMYQHDVKKKQLDEALNDVVSECVSFVGVDINTASHCLLRHVAGLSDKKAQEIINFRDRKGAFISRKQLLEVSGIGEKIFQQCAGFLRVGPLTNEEAISFYKNVKTTKLDRTNIHPESYEITKKLVKKMDLKLSDVGETHFTSTVKNRLSQLKVIELSQDLGSNDQTIQLVLDALSKPLNHDFRNDCPKEAVFKKGLTNINDLKNGSVLTGVVSNVTHFGCFVDIGVGINGLIHVSKYCGLDLQIGTKVEVRVLDVNIDRKRIGLQAVKLIA